MHLGIQYRGGEGYSPCRMPKIYASCSLWALRKAQMSNDLVILRLCWGYARSLSVNMLIHTVIQDILDDQSINSFYALTNIQKLKSKCSKMILQTFKLSCNVAKEIDLGIFQLSKNEDRSMPSSRARIDHI